MLRLFLFFVLLETFDSEVMESYPRTVQELIRLYGLSKNTAYKFLANPPSLLLSDMLESVQTIREYI